MEPSATFQFAPEIEQSLVSVCFADPHLIAVVKRELDLGIHITNPALRHILEAIELTYGQLGLRDFASVIQTLRELKTLERCGGPERVNAIFEEYRYGFSSEQAKTEILAHYIELLQAYALGRQQTPPLPVYHFTGGKGTTTPNKLKRGVRDPDETGAALVAGKKYAVALWRSHEFTNFRLSPTP
jgi:hypothetical protein